MNPPDAIARRIFMIAALGIAAMASTSSAGELPTAPNICGVWHGCWRSDKNGHHGKMNARVVQLDACRFRITFTGTFWKVFLFRYAETFEVTGYSEGLIHLEGAKVLGLGLGTFKCYVTAGECDFTARFQSRGDWGIFTLRRGK